MRLLIKESHLSFNEQFLAKVSFIKESQRTKPKQAQFRDKGLYVDVALLAITNAREKITRFKLPARKGCRSLKRIQPSNLCIARINFHK